MNSMEIDKGRIIVESPMPEALLLLKVSGYLTSYYVPSHLRSLDKEVLQSTLNEIKRSTDRYNNTYISADYRDYPMLKEQYPNQKKLIWFTVYGDENILRTKCLLLEIVLDEKVDVLLVPGF